MDDAKLKTELVGDPLTRGYAGMSNEAAAADGHIKYRTRPVASVTGQQIFEAVVLAEYNELATDQKTLLLGIIGMGTILVNGVNTRAALLGMFVAGTQTRTNLATLQVEQITRWTDLDLGNVKAGDVQRVRK